MLRRALIVLLFTLAAFAQSNAELARIYKEDQAEREHQFTITPDQMREIATRDTVRRQRVRELLDSGALHTSEDYVRAAFLFQHGSTPDDFLVAHVLGLIATR
ncbi:MAG TPA: hypothetical protein VN736_00815 [Candidatus Limnocylindrales bacterium]|nr:hypothetical protein [Candidatus Limnocylindrales bacterium]